MKTILAVDIGTSSTRARLYLTDNLSPVPGASHQIPHEPEATAEGGSTLSAIRIVQETIACCRAALDHAPAGTRVDAVGISCFWHSIVGIDHQGSPTTEILLWSDRRSADQVERLRQLHPDAPGRTGCPWHTSYVPGRLAWLAETHPTAFGRSAQFLSPAAFLTTQLFGPGQGVESTSMASASGLWNQHDAHWDPEIARAIGIQTSQLGPVRDSPHAGLLGDARKALPELSDIPWFPAIGDGAASNLGSGVAAPGRIALMIGTSAAMRTAVPGTSPPDLPEGLWRYQIGPEHFLLGGALTNGGAVWAWLERNLRLDHEQQARIDTMAPDSHGLAFLPLMAGERAPLWRDDLQSAITGISYATTPADIARASLEAVAYRLAAVRERLRDCAPSATLIGTGAALLASPAWQQILADVLQEPLEVSAEAEASARGAALWARQQAGLGNCADAPDPDVIARRLPNAAASPIYQAARARHEALFRAING